MQFAFARLVPLIFLFAGSFSFAETGTDSPQIDVKKKVDREDQSVLQRHRPFYFAYGNPVSKLQVSFKTPIVRDWPLYFGYTQFMFWALTEKSKPFRDLTYNPELFYRLDKRWGLLSSVDFGIFAHNSNGKGGKDSRSLDEQYVRLNFDHEGRRWMTRFAVQGAYLHGFDDTNKNIQKFLGPLSVSVSFIQLFDGSWIDKSEINLQATPGGKLADSWDYGGYQLSWSFRLGGIDLVPAFYLQYYHGFAETLLNYDKRVSEFRGGIIF
jgi:outer membrane phospholipase A